MAKNKIEWSEEAKSDLRKILDFYIHRNGNSKYSIKLSRKIKKAVSLLKNQKHIGYRSDFGNTRVIIEGDYCIFYEIYSKSIAVVAIWDSRQDPELLNEVFSE